MYDSDGRSRAAQLFNYYHGERCFYDALRKGYVRYILSMMVVLVRVCAGPLRTLSRSRRSAWKSLQVSCGTAFSVHSYRAEADSWSSERVRSSVPLARGGHCHKAGRKDLQPVIVVVPLSDTTCMRRRSTQL